VTDIQYSPHYQHVLAAGTFEYANWYHNGTLWLMHVDSQKEDRPQINTVAKLDNKTAVQAVCWSEYFVSSVMTANYDWCMLQRLV